MDLQEFVRLSIHQITEGVRQAQEAVRGHGGFVNPASYPARSDQEAFFGTLRDGQNVFLLDFDVAVTVNETTGTNANAGLKVASFISLGTGGNSASSQASTSRLRFKVPIALPVDAVSQRKLIDERREAEAACEPDAIESRY